jgi:hypothetical protein
MDKTPASVGIAWYERKDWPRALDIFSDRLLLPSSYDKWLAGAEAVANRIRLKGATPVKVYIDPSSFPKWCRVHGLEPNARARSQFAQDHAQDAAQTTDAE